MKRDELRDLAAILRPMLIGAAVLALMVIAAFSLPGCGPRAVVVQRQYDHTQATCREQARALFAQCPHGAVCVARLDAAKAACDAELHRICNQNRRARHVCGGGQ